MPLGSQLIVTAPRYVEFSVAAVLEADAGANPPAIEEEVKKELKKRFALVNSEPGSMPRQPGIPVTKRDVLAWMRAVKGVKRVTGSELRGADGKKLKGDEVAVSRYGLPRWNAAASKIEVKRPEPGRPR
jgi:hypothetical protein